MMQQVGMRFPNPSRDRLEGYGLRPFLDQQFARRINRGEAAVTLVEAFANY
jgi:hypothetical protein